MINGRFYFIQTESNNLIGEYSNQNLTKNVTECSNSIDSKGPFIGSFRTTWHEAEDKESIFMTLIITHKKNSNGQLFSLEWQQGDKTAFFGEGFLVSGMLIGNYWDSELNDIIQRG